jgi:hypothetical protein
MIPEHIRNKPLSEVALNANFMYLEALKQNKENEIDKIDDLYDVICKDGV